MAKIKTRWYCDRHRLLTVDAYHEHTIIQHILDETYDDLIAELDADDPVRENMNRVLHKVRAFLGASTVEVANLLKEYEVTHCHVRKDFAIVYNKHPLFGVVMKVIDGNDVYDELVGFIRRNTNRLEEAREWLEKIEE